MEKTVFFKCVLALFVVLAGGMVSCTNDLDCIANETEVTRSLYDKYQVEVVKDVETETGAETGGFEFDLLPVLERQEVCSLLDKMNGLVLDNTVRINDVTKDGVTSYTLSTAGKVDGNNGLNVAIDFIECADNNTLYYKGNRLTCSSGDMHVIGKGFSLSSDNGLHKVVVTGAVYFKMGGDDGQSCIVKIPFMLVGKLDISNDSCTYTCNL